MKKFTLLAVLLIFVLGALAAPAAAQSPTPDLTTFAGYLPADAPVYVAFRTDDAFIAALDDLAARLTPLIPSGRMEETLQQALDRVAADIAPNGTFATTVRSWLGDSAAVGLYSFSMQTMQSPVPPVTIAISITDKDKAEAFFKSLPSNTRYTAKDGDGYTVYSPTGNVTSDPYYIFRDDVLLVTGDESLVESGGAPYAAPLGESDAFTTALGMLPAESYGGVLYMDTPALLNLTMSMMPMRSARQGEQAMMDMMKSIMAALKPQALGLTLLDDHALTLDIASPVDASIMASLGMVQTSHPIDPTFVQHVPAGTPLVVQGTDLYASYERGIEALRRLANAVPETSDMRPEDIETGIWALGFFVRGLTGQETADALGWMSGDYALAFDFSPAFTDATSIEAASDSFPFDFALVVAASDHTAAQATFDGLNRSLLGLPAKDVTVSQETLDGGAPALVFSIHTKDFAQPLELVAALSEDVFAVGTRHMVTAAVDPQNGGLSADPTYTAASSTLLADSSALFYLSGVDLQPLARLMTASGNPLPVRSQGKQLQTLLKLFDSASVSVTVAPDNTGSVARFVITLPE
jgi:hypothetical protein